MALDPTPRRPEIDQSAMKLIIGAIALALPTIELLLTQPLVASISASFWIPDPAVWPRNIFVGFLLAIAAFLLAYNGLSATEMWLSKIASLAAVGVAMFPCGCGVDGREIVKGVHGFSAGTMFIVLACFCFIFLRRAWAKRVRHPRAKWRVGIYAACAAGMIGAAVLFIASKTDGAWIFWAETVGLFSFGVSWLTASRVLPVLTDPADRNKPVVFRNDENANADFAR